MKATKKDKLEIEINLMNDLIKASSIEQEPWLIKQRDIIQKELNNITYIKGRGYILFSPRVCHAITSGLLTILEYKRLGVYKDFTNDNIYDDYYSSEEFHKDTKTVHLIMSSKENLINYINDNNINILDMKGIGRKGYDEYLDL